MEKTNMQHDKHQREDAKHDTSTASTNDAIAGESYVEDMRSRVESVQVKTKINGLPRGVHTPETSTPNGKDKRLTAKMQLFASLLAKDMTPKEAYRKAYDCSRMSEASIGACANELMRDPRISMLMESLWQDTRTAVIADAVSARRMVMADLYKHAKDDKANLGNRLKALELIGRAVGMFTDKVESKVEEVSVDQLKRELESSLELLNNTTMRTATH